MKKIVSIVAMLGCFSGVLSAADFNFGLSGSDEGVDSFSLSVGNYYGVPVQEIREVEYYVPREQMSVVYYLAKRSHRSPRYITNLRQQGMSWWNISSHLGLDPHSIYRDKHSRRGNHRLRDSEVADFVNVRFISDYHHISREEVINRRHKGEKYYHINDTYYQKRHPHYKDERGGNERNGYNERKEHKERKDDRRDDRKHNNHSDKKDRD